MNYMINRDWGVGVRIPDREPGLHDRQRVSAQTTPDFETYHASTVGDIELTGMYTGLSKDMSKGLIFGVKLPTGRLTPRRISTGIPKSAPAAPISFSAASGGA